MSRSTVAVVSTTPETILEDYRRVMKLAAFSRALDPSQPLVLKPELNWSRYYPATNSEPWQLDGVLRALLAGGFDAQRTHLFCADANALRRSGLEPIATQHRIRISSRAAQRPVTPPERLVALESSFPDGLRLPADLVGHQVLLLPTLKTDARAVVGGAVSNAISGWHQGPWPGSSARVGEILADGASLLPQVHPRMFVVMDGTVCGSGGGPRRLRPSIHNVLLAGRDPVAIDAVAARLMGIDPADVPFLARCADRGIGSARSGDIQLVGEDIDGIDFGFADDVRRPWASVWSRPIGSAAVERVRRSTANLGRELFWYPLVGRSRLRRFRRTPWGQLWQRYREGGGVG